MFWLLANNIMVFNPQQHELGVNWEMRMCGASDPHQPQL